MKAHIARNQNAGVPMVLGWNLAPGDRGILDGMADAFGMKVRLVSPDEAGQTVAQLLGEVPLAAARTLRLEPGAYPPAIVLANFRPRDAATLLDLQGGGVPGAEVRSEEHTSELQSRFDLVCRLLLEKKKNKPIPRCD